MSMCKISAWVGVEPAMMPLFIFLVWNQRSLNKHTERGARNQDLVPYCCLIPILVYNQELHPWFYHPNETHLSVDLLTSQHYCFKPPPIRVAFFITLQLPLGTSSIFLKSYIIPVNLFLRVSSSCLLFYLLKPLIVVDFISPPLYYLPLINKVLFMFFLYIFSLTLFFISIVL